MEEIVDIKVEHSGESSPSRRVSIPGLVLRSFQGEEDFPGMLNVIHGSREVDGLDRSETLEDITNNYAHLVNCDPYRDTLFAEVDGLLVGYSRVWWAMEASGEWIGFQFGQVLPEWRRKGIGSALFAFNEKRLGEIAAELIESGRIPIDTPCILNSYASSSELDSIKLIEQHGYRAVRYNCEMLRADMENIPDLPLPPGVEVRAVEPGQFRQIWEASNEAFKDHWGYIPDPWEEFERWMKDPDFDPSLWRVAWQGEQVAGMVLSFIDHEQNRLYGRKRGYTENICVRRPWRRQGLAKALIAMGLKALKQRGMTEAALGVDAENVSGALHLYESMGFRVTKKGTIYHKALNVER